jgi:hypothetical protein
MISVRKVTSMRNAAACSIALFIFSWPWAGVAQEVFQKTDTFSGTVHYSTRLRNADLEGGSFFSGRTVRFNFNMYRSAGSESPYSLGVQTLTNGWVFIRAGASLDLKIDGSNLMHLVGGGSTELRQVLSGDLVREDAFYDLSTDQLGLIAHAKSIEFRLHGDSQIITGTLPNGFMQDANAFGGAVPASQGLAVMPPRQTLGVNFVKLNPAAVAALHLSEDHGLFVVSVDAGSHAEKIGILKTDVILAINSVAMHSGSDVPQGLAASDPAGKITFHIWRGGSLIDLQSDQVPAAK